MKWLSVKKYRPPSYRADCFVYAQNHLHVAYWAGESWCDSEDEDIENVTHFCIPDAVEIEE